MQNINLLQPPCSGASRLKETKKFQPWVQLTPTFDLSGVMDEVEPGSNGHALVNQQFTSTPEGCCQGHGNTGSPKFPGKCHTPDVTRFPAQGDVNNHVPPGKSYIQGNPALTNTSTFPAATGHSVSSATKGARYDETDGGVDDRTGMQKLADKLSPGSAIGKHTSDVAGWAPNAGPSHGYDTGDGPTRFTAGHVASDYEGDVSNSRNDITGPTADAATVTADKGNGLPFEKPPHYITNEFGDVVDIDPATALLTPVPALIAIKVMARAMQHMMWALGEVLAALAVPQRSHMRQFDNPAGLTAGLGRPSSVLGQGPQSYQEEPDMMPYAVHFVTEVRGMPSSLLWQPYQNLMETFDIVDGAHSMLSVQN
ncbi:hypothetical protein WJX79_001243 [Trebouxia sp. C0005]